MSDYSRVLRDIDENRVIGQLLIQQGLVTSDQVESALYIQAEKPHLRVGEILMSMGVLTIDQLDKVLKEHLSHQFIGALLFSSGFISQEQLAQAMAVHETSSKRFGEIVVDLGFVTEYQLQMLLEKQKTLRRPQVPEMNPVGRWLKRTKLVATIGPSCATDEVVEEMIQSGVNVFRLNFSHGRHEDHLASIERIRRCGERLGESVGILQDIQGPKIRIGEVENGQVTLIAGSRFRLRPDPVVATAGEASVTFERLLTDIAAGSTVLLDDGKLELTVEGVSDGALNTVVKVGGILKPRKGVNFPGSTLGISIITEKDRQDLIFGAEHGVDMVAASFVQTAADVAEVKAFMAEHGSRAPVIAKIERPQAVYSLQEILAIADGVMVARGDLGVEMHTEDVPLIQKQIIRQANIACKPVITATQMLDSMVSAPRPTRAEASDVANAIIDGTDAVMLSNETAAGSFPVEAVRTMTRIIEKVEQMERQRRHIDQETHRELGEAITAAATHLASEIDAAAIVVPAHTGSSARLVSKFRPRCIIIATSSSAAVCRQMSLSWGVYALHIPGASAEEMHPATVPTALKRQWIASGDQVVVMETVRGAVARSRGVRVETALEYLVLDGAHGENTGL